LSETSRVVIKRDPYNAEAPLPALADPITRPASHYVRSNFAVPTLDHAEYALQIDGAVAEPASLSWATLSALPRVDAVMTMECAGNDRLGMRPVPTGEPWDSGAVSTAHWRGVRLRDVLATVTLAHDVTEILATGADSGPRDDALVPGPVTFARALPLAVAQHPDTLLAMEMNGAPLPPEHGAPVRLIVPGWYGMANVKWVVRLSALREAFTGYFHQQRYVYEQAEGVTPVTFARVKSMITAPSEGARLPLVGCTVRGWAWSGTAPIAGVDVAVGGGDAWQPATLGPAPGAHAWTPWWLELPAPPEGRLTLRSRATDADGRRQPETVPWNRLGYGNNAVRPVTVHIGP
jgi:DMSO/TMAO reductase YedYZ molybdopterin-dependent catalytic subunit